MSQNFHNDFISSTTSSSSTYQFTSSSSTNQSTSRLSNIQAQFQQKQMAEKEKKLLDMLDSQQQRAMQKASLSGHVPQPKTSTGRMSSTSGTISSHSRQSSNNSPSNNISTPAGKVRQMFEERRKVGPGTSGGGGGVSSNGIPSSSSYRNGGLIGIDKSYPLEPIVVTPSTIKTTTSGGNKGLRSSSSKSDPPPLPLPLQNKIGKPPIYQSTNTKNLKQLPPISRNSKNTTITPIPTGTTTTPATATATNGNSLGRNNNNNRNRNNSSSRNSSGGSLTSTPTPNTLNVLGRRSSSSGSGSGGGRNGFISSSTDENANEEFGTTTPTSQNMSPILPNTTKYSDYYTNNNLNGQGGFGLGQEYEDDELNHREMILGTKLREMNISPPSMDLRPPPPLYSPPKISSPTSKKSSTSTSPIFQTKSPTGKNNNNNAVVGNKKSPTNKIVPTSTTSTTSTGKKISNVGNSTNKSPSSPKRSGPPPPGLEECHICHRCFASDRIQKHETICKKTTAASKKRKIFDPTKMRMQGTEAEPYLRVVSAKLNKPSPPPVKKVDWRKKHEDFINTIRAAKVYQKHVDSGGNPADLPPPPPTDTSDYIQCPHCQRKFNQGAAERHIPKCQNIKSNKNKR